MEDSAPTAPQKTKKKVFLDLAAPLHRLVSHELYQLLFPNATSPALPTDLSHFKEDEEIAEFVEPIQEFLRVPQLALSFDGVGAPLLPSPARAKLHRIAEECGLTHETITLNAQRVLVLGHKRPVSRPGGSDYELQEYLFAESYWGVRGALINQVAEYYSHYISPSVRQKKKDRDGDHYHITLASRKSLAKMADEKPLESVFEQLATTLTDDWTPLGVGKVANAEGLHAFFVVLSWPSATQLLAQLGFEEQHFHITLGFQQNDVHDVPKDASTLVPTLELDSLVSMAAVTPPPAAVKKTGTRATAKAVSPKAPTAPPSMPAIPLIAPGPFISGPPVDHGPSIGNRGPSGGQRCPQPGDLSPADNVSPFQMFMKEREPTFKAENPGMYFLDLALVMGNAFEALPDAEKKRYEEAAVAETEKNKRARAERRPPATLVDKTKNPHISLIAKDIKHTIQRHGPGGGPGADAPTPLESVSAPLEKPRLPMSAFMLFARDKRESVRAELPDAKITELTQELGNRWKSLPDTEKHFYQDQADAARAKYSLEKSAYDAASSAQGEAASSSGGKKSSGRRLKKVRQNVVKRALSAYMFYVQAKRESMKTEFPDASVAELSRKLGERWATMDDTEKEVYATMARTDQERYKAELEILAPDAPTLSTVESNEDEDADEEENSDEEDNKDAE